MNLKRVLIYAAVIPAIYLSPPANKFNIVQASDGLYHGKTISNTKLTEESGSVSSEPEKTALQAHAYMMETFLKVSMQYLDGFERQLKADVSIASPVVKEHAELYAQQSLEAIKNAQMHMNEYLGVAKRVPASLKDSGKLGDTSDAKAKLDQALSRSQLLVNHIEQAGQTKDSVKQELAKVRDAVKDAYSKVKSLKYAS